VWTWNSRRGELKTVQNVVTYPEGFDGVITTADLHMTPNGKFLYVSNRDITDRKARTGRDSIVGFQVNQRNGRLDMIGHFPCEHVPRSFALSESGKFAFVAGQGDDRLGVYRIDQETGALKKVEQIETGARPSWVLCFKPSGE
jgi:6-phosphogluconolactonase